MLFSFGNPSAQQEEQAGIALTALFADPAAFDGALATAKKHGSAAHVVEIAPEDRVGSIGRTTAFSNMRRQFMDTHPDVVDILPVTIKRLATFGHTNHAGVAIYVQEPTPLRRAGVWFFDLMR